MFYATVMIFGVFGHYKERHEASSMSARESEEEETTTALPVLVTNATDLADKELRSNATADGAAEAFMHLRKKLMHLRKSGHQLVHWSLVAVTAALREQPTMMASVMPLVGCVVGLLVWRVGCKGRKRTSFEEAPEKMDGDFRPIALLGCCDMTQAGLLEWLCCMPCMWMDTVLRSGVYTCGKMLQLVLVLLVFTWALPLLCQSYNVPFSSLSQFIGTVLMYYALFQARRGMLERQEELSAEGEIKEEIQSFFWTRFMASYNVCPAGTSATCLEDAATVVCCAPCTIAQEAQYQEVAEMASNQDALAGLLEW